jgi:hypothetical protein
VQEYAGGEGGFWGQNISFQALFNIKAIGRKLLAVSHPLINILQALKLKRIFV